MSARAAYQVLHASLQIYAKQANCVDIELVVSDMRLNGGSWDPAYFSHFTERFPGNTVNWTGSIEYAADFVALEFIEEQRIIELKPFVAALRAAASSGKTDQVYLAPWFDLP